MVFYLGLIGYCLLLTGLCLGLEVTTVRDYVTELPDPDDSTSMPEYIIYSDQKLPCFLSTINVTIRINYKAQSGILNEVYNKEMSLSNDDETIMNGSCDNNVTYLTMTWWNGVIGLNLTFVKEEKVLSESVIEGKWWASEIHLFYDTSISAIFPEAIKGAPEEVSKDGMDLFKSPLGMSFSCDSQERITIGSRQNAAIVSFRHVRLQAFAIHDTVFSKANECDEDVEIILKKRVAYIVPMIVGSCLAVICMFVVIGYAIGRKINKYQDQSSYKPMD